MKTFFVLFFPLLCCLITCKSRTNLKEETQMVGKFSSLIQKLRPLHTKMPKPQPGEWLYVHEEKGQTFAEYVKSQPIKVNKTRNKIYILPLGDFDKDEKQILYLTVQYLQIYFNLEVVLQTIQSDAIIPETARRSQNLGFHSNEQLLTSHIMYEILLPKLPQDAITYMALTTKDLYPEPSWNFVFGQASTQKRIGVSSMYRLRDFDFSQSLRRVIATASHEIGHMLTIQHCITYECVMNGSNSLEESDLRPTYPCAECLMKLAWNVGFDLRAHFINLKAFYRRNKLNKELLYCEKASKVLE